MKSHCHSLLAAATTALLSITLLNGCRPQQEASTEKNDTPKTALGFDVAFEPAAFTIRRDYDQRGEITLVNRGDTIAEIRVHSVSPHRLAAGFVGRGSEDWHEFSTIRMNPGDRWTFPFVMHGHFARATGYTAEVFATALHEDGEWREITRATVPITLEPSTFDLAVHWEKARSVTDESRLVQTLVITNNGDPIPDLEFEVLPPEDGAETPVLFTFPMVNRVYLSSGNSFRVDIAPAIRPDFKEAHALLRLTGNDGVLDVPFSVTLPEGKRVYSFLTRSISSSTGGGTACTNLRNVTYRHPPVSGTPAPSPTQTPTPSFGGGGGGGTLVGSGGGGDAPEEEEEEDAVWGFTGLGDVVSANNELAANPLPSDASSAADTDENQEPFTPAVNDPETLATQSASAVAESTLAAVGEMIGSVGPEAFGSEMVSLSDALKDAVAANGGRPFADDDPIVEALGRRYDVELKENQEGRIPSVADVMNEGRLISEPRDPEANSVQKTVYRDESGTAVGTVRKTSENTSAFEFHDFGFGIGGPGRVIGRSSGGGGSPTPAPVNPPVPVTDGTFEVRDPIISRGTGDQALAAYTRPLPEGGSVVEVKDIASGRLLRFGAGENEAAEPRLVRGEGGTDLVFRDIEGIKRVRLPEDFDAAPAPPELLQASTPEAPVRSLLNARRTPDGEVAVLVANGDSVSLVNAGAAQPITIAARSADFDFDSEGRAVIVARTAEGAIRLDRSDGLSMPLVPPTGNPLQTPGRPALSRTPGGELQALFHVPLATPINPNEPLPPIERLGGTFNLDLSEAGLRNPAPVRTFPSEQPVRNATFMLDMQPSDRSPRLSRKLTDTVVRINGQVIGRLNNRAPSGRYLFNLPPDILTYTTIFNPNPVSFNWVHLEVAGIGPGNVHLARRSKIVTSHSLVLQSVVAADEATAERVAVERSVGLHHNFPDLVLTNNLWEPPHRIASGESVTAVVGLFNAGDVPVPAGMLTVYHEEREIARIPHPAVAPFTTGELRVEFPMPDYDPDAGTVLVLHAPVEGDVSPDDNELRLQILPDFVPFIGGPFLPSGIDPNHLGPDELMDVDPRDEAVVVPLRTGSQWFRLPVASRGQIIVEIENTPQRAVLGVDLFDVEGHMLSPSDQSWTVVHETVFVRVGIRPGIVLAPDSTIRLAWEIQP